MDASSTLWEVFSRSLRTNATRPAVTAQGRTRNYAEIARNVAWAAGQLRQQGLARGDRVVLLLDNGAAFAVYDLALMSLGAVKVPVNPLASARDVASIVERVDARVLVLSPALEDLAREVPGRVARLDDRLGETDAELLPASPAAAPEDPAVIYFTGGTTGTPKGIVHDQRGVVANLWAHLLESEIRREDHVLVNTPMAHAAGLFTLAALLRGARVSIDGSFDASQVLDRIHLDGVTWLFAVPTTIYRLLDEAERRGVSAGSLRTVQYGAAPIAPAQLERALRLFGPVFQQLYAQTENPNYGTLLRKEDHVRALAEPHLLASAGRATIMCDVAILDEDGHRLPAGERGEVALASPYQLQGYWGDPDGAAERLSDGWLRTGDIGYLDEEGFLFLIDRRNDMIVTGGMNVYSIEVEQALTEHPAVSSAAVVGVPHPDWGEQVVAYLIADADTDLDDVRRRCRDVLAAYKCPKDLRIVSAFPLTPYGKVDKVALRRGDAERAT